MPTITNYNVLTNKVLTERVILGNNNEIETIVISKRNSNEFDSIIDRINRPGGMSNTSNVYRCNNESCNGIVLQTKLIADNDSNQVRNAKLRCKGANTIIDKDYYVSTTQYLKSKGVLNGTINTSSEQRGAISSSHYIVNKSNNVINA
jgi:hypothetical protein